MTDFIKKSGDTMRGDLILAGPPTADDMAATKAYVDSGGGGGSSGTVTSVSVVTANGVSGSVANPTTTPALTLTLGAITPSSVNAVVLSGSSTPTLAVTGTTTVSGANTGDQTLPVKATGTELNTGADDAKFATAKAIADSTVTTSTKTQTLTNKRVTARVQSVTNAATITPDADANDCVDITAIGQDFSIANNTGTPTNFQKLIIRIKDDGGARAITFGTNYVAGGAGLPSVTVSGKILYCGFIYNTANGLNKWQLVASSQES